MIAAERDPQDERPRTRRAVGRDYEEWFALLDQWGAPGRPFREIADWLVGEHALSAWWAQKLIVEYEQARGSRPPGARPGGTFTVGASKTVGVPVGRLYQAVADLRNRQRWLPDVVLTERTSRPHRSIRFDWVGDGTRVSVTFDAKGDGRSQVAVEHDLLPDPATAQQARAFWRKRLADLKTVLENK
ncbi:hypothetical protein [Kibdelosporangium phytohabitans]|uniref:SRPBCC domain-containing protein n=1 Tax=Kibdelosporangium phytohabitans TaxID=860235 RepID=A0A0N9HXK4_9PSEU|nr:hypothetical protein [Kibdelosporangium phytohabitans]ALG08235.1 hypothetical protein AOZ06_16125 [Kibdelosporangium phytohabitans]MBE1470759.1 hypothetical protein [Kibdelosporangium phytohabitans]